MISAALVALCVSQAATTQDVPEQLVWTILKTEAGHLGQSKRNSNGSYDLGPMQVNDRAWLKVLAPMYGVSQAEIRHALLHDACFNIGVGTWILKQALKENPDKGVWEGIARYNTHTNDLKRHYQLLVNGAAASLYGNGTGWGGTAVPPGVWSIPVMQDTTEVAEAKREKK